MKNLKFQPRQLKKQGFTLIELLVVIAIIAILAAILFPVFARARDNARRASCSSNLKQIGLAIAQYTQDYDERYPAFVNTIPSGGAGTFGAFTDETSNPGKASQPYLKSYQVFLCPSASIGPGEAANAITTNYLWNGVLMRSAGLSMAAVPAPANIIMTQEFANGSTNAYNRPGLITAYSTTNYSAWLTVNYNNMHFEGGNLLYADGHVKWRRHSDTCAADFGLGAVSAGPACGDWQDGATAPATF